MDAYRRALDEIGTLEWADGSNPKVVAYFRDAGQPGVKDDATAWCAAFVGAMLARAGSRGTGTLLARDYLKWGRAVDLSDAQPGDIVVFRRGTSSWQGHVGFLVGRNGAFLDVLGGNQRDQVSIARQPVAHLLGVRRGDLGKAPATAPETAPIAPQQPAAQQPARKPAPGLWAALWALLASILGRSK